MALSDQLDLEMCFYYLVFYFHVVPNNQGTEFSLPNLQHFLANNFCRLKDPGYPKTLAEKFHRALFFTGRADPTKTMNIMHLENLSLFGTLV